MNRPAHPLPADLACLPIIRAATEADLDALYGIETTCFSSDRLSRRSLRRFLHSHRDILLLAELAGKPVGYILVLRRRGTRLARLYSLAVTPQARGHGLGELLVRAGEDAADDAGCVDMRLEVRRDNAAAIALYQRLGYRVFDEIAGYYEDDEDALRFQKRIHAWEHEGLYPEVPYYPQHTEFSCGPACLIMAMAALGASDCAGLANELAMWREATTIFMTSGHGGCGPHGIALAAVKRGYRAQVFVNQAQALFVDGVRNAERKALLEQIHEFFVADCQRYKVPIKNHRLSVDEIAGKLQEGWMPIVLISHYRLTREKAPHWVIVTAVDGDFVYLHDPELRHDDGQSALDMQYIPIERTVFEGMSRFGQSNLRATVLVGRGRRRRNQKL